MVKEHICAMVKEHSCAWHQVDAFPSTDADAGKLVIVAFLSFHFVCFLHQVETLPHH
jgi:hypothetical protein